MKLIAFLLLLLTFSSTKQACAAGCLKCDSSSNCIVPDLSKNYVLSNNTAVASTLTNCLILNADGTCASCAANYFLDATTAKCVVVPTASQITNCSFYNTASSCRLCAAGFYLNNNACSAVTATIANCSAYSNATTCSACAAQYVLSLDSTSCVSVSSVQNCSGYSYVSCGSCASGYHINRNSYLDNGLPATATTSATTTTNTSTNTSSNTSANTSNNTSANTSTNATANNALANFARSIINSTGYSGAVICQSNANTNCATFTADSSICTLCNAGYFLDTTGACNAYPNEPIANCAIYNSATSCNSCATGYLLNNNACTAIASSALIANCATYATNSSSVSCLTCATGYYLASANTCTARVNSLNLANCATFSNTQDLCTACSTGYTLSGDSLKCFAVIANCAAYQSSTKNDTQVQCQTCASTYLLVAASNGGQNSCTAGNIANCSIYSNATTCTTCVDGYYLANATTCTAQPAITNCTNYDGDSNNTAIGKCLTCSAANSFLVNISNTCQTITTPIAQCISYSGTVASPVCNACAANYALNTTANTCIAATITNCVDIVVNGAVNPATQTCAACAAGYIINYNATACIASLAYLKDQCLDGLDNDPNNNASVNGAIPTTAYYCYTCNQGAFPINYQNQFSCVSLAETAQLNAGTAITAANSANCLKYDTSFNCLQCDPASTNLYLQTVSGVSSCVSACTTNAYTRYVLNGNFQIVQYNVCNPGTAIAGCAIYAPDLTAANPATSNVCVQCASSYLPLASPTTAAYSNADPNAAAPAANAVLYSTYIPSPFAKFVSVTCLVRNGSNTIGGNASNVDGNLTANCAFYGLVSGSDYACLKCNTGFSGTITSAGFLSACTTDSACNTTTKYYNLDVAINNLASCRVCTTSGTIPVIAYTSVSAGDPTFSRFSQYNYVYASGNVLRNNSGTEKNVVCRSVASPPTGFVVGATPQNWGGAGFYTGTNYANCGILAVNLFNEGNNSTTVSGGVTTVNYGNFCAACAPGFAATLTDTTNTYIKKTCTAINNCPTTGNMFNGCSTCNTGSILEFVTANTPQVSFTSCLTIAAASTTNLANCYAAIVDATTAGQAGVCAVCKPGYNLNVDNFCEAIQPYGCTAGAFRISSNNTAANLNWQLYANGNAAGCNRCTSGNIAYQVTTAKRACVASAYITSTVDSLTSSSYVEHCKNYNATNAAVLKCVNCQANYVLNFAGVANAANATICYPNTSLANCGIASTATVCAECATAAYGLLPAGTCVAGNVSNCATYNYDGANNTGATAALCASCNNGYYLNGSNACVAGSITNCNNYASASRCNTCATGYFLIDNTSNNNGPSGANIADLCVPNPTALNCSDVGVDSSGNYTCNTCTNNTTQVAAAPAASAAKNACISFSPVTNCATYNAGAFASSAFTCATCASGYYLSGNQCVARTTINKCVTYTPGANTCAACDSTSYLSSDSLTCITNPNGVFKCNTYSNATTCTACKPGYYLSNNTCVAVTTAIANCSTYSNATTCSLCATGYALTNNTCVQATAQNCLTYASANACASCANTYILSTTTATTGSGNTAVTTSTTSCVLATNKPNCATIDYQSPNNCTSCNAGYYLNNGACTAATAIAHCTVYASATTCSQCDATYALSVDKTACVTNNNVTAYEDANCNNNQLVSSPVCSRCGAGRYFVNGACTGTCSQVGCLACKASSNSVCAICNTGYYQDSTGKCNAIGTDAQDGNASIFGVLSAIVLVFAVMFK